MKHLSCWAHFVIASSGGLQSWTGATRQRNDGAPRSGRLDDDGCPASLKQPAEGAVGAVATEASTARTTTSRERVPGGLQGSAASSWEDRNRHASHQRSSSPSPQWGRRRAPIARELRRAGCTKFFSASSSVRQKARAAAVRIREGQRPAQDQTARRQPGRARPQDQPHRRSGHPLHLDAHHRQADPSRQRHLGRQEGPLASHLVLGRPQRPRRCPLDKAIEARVSPVPPLTAPTWSSASKFKKAGPDAAK